MAGPRYIPEGSRAALQGLIDAKDLNDLRVASNWRSRAEAAVSAVRFRNVAHASSYWWRVREFEIWNSLGFGGTNIGTYSYGSPISSGDYSGEPSGQAMNGYDTDWWGSSAYGSGVWVGIRFGTPVASETIRSARIKQVDGHHASFVAVEGEVGGAWFEIGTFNAGSAPSQWNGNPDMRFV